MLHNGKIVIMIKRDKIQRRTGGLCYVEYSSRVRFEEQVSRDRGYSAQKRGADLPDKNVYGSMAALSMERCPALTDEVEPKPRADKAAAEGMAVAVEKAIYKRLNCAEAFETCHSAKECRYPYCGISVKNFTICYAVIGNIMEMRRIPYSRRDTAKEI